MAKKEDKAENPQTKTWATVPTGQEPPQDNTGESMANQPTPGGAADDAEPPTKKREPKVSDAVQKIGKALLKSNPDMSVVYMTADGCGFYERNDADNHARTLNNKVVTPVKR